VFSNGGQWDLKEFKLTGFDIRKVPLKDICTWIKAATFTESFELAHCNISPAIMEGVLDALASKLDGTDHESIEVRLFDQEI